ncbi:hypothetical protein BO70DRAFT_378248 [Aspergillus heteromorphus CBS 117.55]|uniref:Ubiquitin-like domain-containing protein n=1 Tax=Aspergillus heteromorphus CBS 117.55 TaxID=1448321 RepID=A0A317WMQ4_9EURO|nr:uncharacterized protein BO70DRAFT_378248 [Aspergillus heteromorphus CBS 117.55]PWY87659.1 hypothetical protein BO70DRAFT_378248 [Aspergillus heteromorphus CBS 117.55]
MSTPSSAKPTTPLTLDAHPPAEPLCVTIRFSASITDLPLDIFSPETTTSAGLKQLIRTRLPPNLSSHRLRLIHAGRGLEDKTPLSVSLKLPPTPTRSPRPEANDGESDSKDKGKGKAPVRNNNNNKPRLYIHCSIGDIVLSEADLAAEAAIASTLHEQQREQRQRRRSSLSDGGHRKDGAQQNTQQQQQQEGQSSTTTPAPRGFDRLLSAGFTAAEVAGLRSQFLAVQSVSRTPDTMPTGAELRELEDRWMDEGSSAAAMAAGGGEAGDGGCRLRMMMGGLGLGRVARWMICFGER